MGNTYIIMSDAKNKSAKQILEFNIKVFISRPKALWIYTMIEKDSPAIGKAITLSMKEFAKQAWDAAKDPTLDFKTFNDYLDSL